MSRTGAHSRFAKALMLLLTSESHPLQAPLYTPRDDGKKTVEKLPLLAKV